MTDRISSCPQCGKSCRIDSENQWRPFCCERCKLLDLGDWVEERFRIPSESQDGILEHSESDPD